MLNDFQIGLQLLHFNEIVIFPLGQCMSSFSEVFRLFDSSKTHGELLSSEKTVIIFIERQTKPGRRTNLRSLLTLGRILDSNECLGILTSKVTKL